jgi:hypothetical protein
MRGPQGPARIATLPSTCSPARGHCGATGGVNRSTPGGRMLNRAGCSPPPTEHSCAIAAGRGVLEPGAAEGARFTSKPSQGRANRSSRKRPGPPTISAQGGGGVAAAEYAGRGSTRRLRLPGARPVRSCKEAQDSAACECGRRSATSTRETGCLDRLHAPDLCSRSAPPPPSPAPRERPHRRCAEQLRFDQGPPGTEPQLTATKVRPTDRDRGVDRNEAPASLPVPVSPPV